MNRPDLIERRKHEVMDICSICNEQFPDEEMTQIGLGSGVFQCDTCWDNYGEEV